MTKKTGLLGVLLLTAATFVAYAQEVLPLREWMAYSVDGFSKEGHLTLTIQVAQKAPIQAMRVYSEPSHTLLLNVVDSVFEKTPQGIEFLKEEAAGTMSTTIAGAAGRMQVNDKRPSADSRVSVWALFSDGRYLNTSHAQVDRNAFGISSALPK